MIMNPEDQRTMSIYINLDDRERRIQCVLDFSRESFGRLLAELEPQVVFSFVSGFSLNEDF